MEGTPETGGPEVRVRSVVSSFADVDPEGLTEAERVAVVSALEAVKGAAAAAQARLTAAAVVDREALGEDARSVRADLALARRCSPTLADQHVGVARALVGEMPETMAAPPEPLLVPDAWMSDVHIQDRPLPEDPWGGWIPDPPDDWFTPDEFARVA